MLLDAGADIDAKNAFGLTPIVVLALAESQDFDLVVRLLVAARAKPKVIVDIEM